MQLARHSNPFRRGCLITAAVAAIMMVSFVLLLSSGALEGLVREIVLRATSGEDMVVLVYGGTSNLFSSTSVDSVIVTDSRGLKVELHGASVSGSVFRFLLNRSVESIHMDTLLVVTPSPYQESADSTLASVFAKMLEGFAAKADRVELDYGRITDHEGALLMDSLQLKASITDIENVTVELISVNSFIPLFGRVSISGVLGMDSLSVSLTDFLIDMPPGSLKIAGTLYADSTLDFAASGILSTAFLPELPFSTVVFNGLLAGTMSAPHGQISISEGLVHYDSLLIEVASDTITIDLNECSISNLTIRTGEVASSISGRFNYSDLSWNGSALLSFQNTDLSSCFAGIPETDLTGTLSFSGYGVSDMPEQISAAGNFTSSMIESYTVNSLSFDCNGDPSGIEGQFSISSERGFLESVFSLSLGDHFVPAAWRGNLTVSIPDFSELPFLPDPSFNGIRGFTADLSGEGTSSAFTVAGGLGISSFSGDEVNAEGIFFNGDVSSVSSVITAVGSLEFGSLRTVDMALSEFSYVGSFTGGEGSSSDFAASGRAEISAVLSEEAILEGVYFNGDVSSVNAVIRGAGSLELDKLRTDDIELSQLSYEGSFRSGESGIAARGVLGAGAVAMLDSLGAAARDATAFLNVQYGRESQSAVCSLLVAEAEYQGILADSIRFNGELAGNRNGITGTGDLAVDTILAGGVLYSLHASCTAEPGSVHVDSIGIGAPGNLNLGLSGMFTYNEGGLGFSLNGIALTRARKLRLISRGDMELHTDSSGVFLDSLWIDLPSGEITAEGFFTVDSLEVSADLSNVDISSLTSMMGLSVPLSGILEIDASFSGKMGDIQTELDLMVDHPTYDEWDQSDSLTLNLSSSGDSLIIDGLWSWSHGIRSGLKMGFDGIWNSERTLDIGLSDIMWLEAELTGVGDELFYLLPVPLKTSGASISARIEYWRDSAELSAGVSSHFDKLYLTNPGIEFPGVSAYFTYPSLQEDQSYNGNLIVNSGDGQQRSLQATVLFDVKEDLGFSMGSLPLELGGYSFQADFNRWETLIAGVGWIQLSGTLRSNSSDMSARPLIEGNIGIDAATLSMEGGGALEGSAGSTSSSEELPIDLNIRISGDRKIWFRNSYSNVELSTQIDVTTVRRMLSVGGDIRAIRGGISLLGREFRITQGEVRIIQTSPLGIELDIQAEAKIRSSVSGVEYIITVTVTGDPANPDILLSATGPSGVLSERDMVTLLTAGMTYGELQQFDSTALGNAAGSYLGQWLARSIRDDVGLDALQFTPGFSSATTSLVVDAGKYVLPDLFVSFSSDVFSSEAGTVTGQYFINRNFFLEGSTKSTITGSQNPSAELHYTFSY